MHDELQWSDLVFGMSLTIIAVELALLLIGFGVTGGVDPVALAAP